MISHEESTWQNIIWQSSNSHVKLPFSVYFKMKSLQIILFFSFTGISTAAGPLTLNFNGPPLPERNFLPIWNSPTYVCHNNWNISLNLSQYGIVANDDMEWNGKFMNIFYDNVGLWPYYDDKGEAINGGLPQVTRFYIKYLYQFAVCIKRKWLIDIDLYMLV